LADSAEGRIIEAYCRAIGVNSRSKARSAILRAEGIYANVFGLGEGGEFNHKSLIE
jgi:hypothetical protein